MGKVSEVRRAISSGQFIKSGAAGLYIRAATVLLFVALGGVPLRAADAMDITGKVTDPQGLAVPGARVTLAHSEGSGTRETMTDDQGNFVFRGVDSGAYTISAQAGPFKGVSKSISISAARPNVVEIQFGEVASHNTVVIVGSTIEPSIDQRNGEIYKKTLFESDDQLLESLGAGINAGQHEGGWKIAGDPTFRLQS